MCLFLSMRKIFYLSYITKNKFQGLKRPPKYSRMIRVNDPLINPVLRCLTTGWHHPWWRFLYSLRVGTIHFLWVTSRGHFRSRCIGNLNIWWYDSHSVRKCSQLADRTHIVGSTIWQRSGSPKPLIRLIEFCLSSILNMPSGICAVWLSTKSPEIQSPG